MMAGWDVRFTAPNGANGHFTMAADEPEHRVVDAFTAFMRSAKKHDADPLAGIAGSPPSTQPVKSASRK